MYAEDTADLKANDVFEAIKTDCPEKNLIVIGDKESLKDFKRPLISV